MLEVYIDQLKASKGYFYRAEIISVVALVKTTKHRFLLYCYLEGSIE